MKKLNTRARSLSFAPETENETFGKFILQTNEVQTTLAVAILLYSSLRDKEYNKFLFERAMFGQLIFMFQACIKRIPETQKLLPILKHYNKSRQKIAHDMHLSEKRFNQNEAEQAMKIGKDILKTLDSLINDKHKLMSKY